MFKFALIFMMALVFTVTAVSVGTVSHSHIAADCHDDHETSHSHDSDSAHRNHHCCTHSHATYLMEANTLHYADSFVLIFIETLKVAKAKPYLEGPFEPPRC